MAALCTQMKTPRCSKATPPGWAGDDAQLQFNRQTRKLEVYTSDISIRRQLKQEDPKFEFQASLGYVRLISNKTLTL